VSPTNSAPAVTNPGDQRDVIGVPTATTIAATDPDGDALTFTATGLPAGLSFSPGGAISGTPTTVGTTRTEVTVADTAGHTTSMSFAWEITHPPFTCSVDRATRTLSWTDQGASSYQIRHTVDGVESYLKQVSGLSTPVSALYGTYRVTYSRNGIKFDTTCDGPALPPSLFACHIDVPTSTLSWTDQGALSYSIRRIVNGVETYLGSVSGLSTTITMPTATHSVTYNDSGTKVTTICSP
jgi:Putative Ig domain